MSYFNEAKDVYRKGKGPLLKMCLKNAKKLQKKSFLTFLNFHSFPLPAASPPISRAVFTAERQARIFWLLQTRTWCGLIRETEKLTRVGKRERKMLCWTWGCRTIKRILYSLGFELYMILDEGIKSHTV